MECHLNGFMYVGKCLNVKSSKYWYRKLISFQNTLDFPRRNFHPIHNLRLRIAFICLRLGDVDEM